MKIEQSAQEALRAREEIRAADITEVQNKGLTMTSEARARGLLLMEHAHRVIDQLWNEPDLVEIERVPADKPVEI
jgi:hypothetical protein